MKDSKSEKKSSSGRRFSEEFKQDAVRLIVKEGYTFRSAADSLGVSEKSLRDWHKRLAPKAEPCGDDATKADLKAENARLRRELKRAEMERAILKKGPSGIIVVKSDLNSSSARGAAPPPPLSSGPQLRVTAERRATSEGLNFSYFQGQSSQLPAVSPSRLHRRCGRHPKLRPERRARREGRNPFCRARAKGQQGRLPTVKPDGPKKSDGVLCEGVAVKYAWIRAHRDSFPIDLMCEVLKVSRSGYYASIDRPKSQRAERTAKIEASVRQVFGETDSIYGSAKIAEELAERDELETACRATVAAAMSRLSLCSKVRKSFRPTTTKSDPSKQPAPNLLARRFEADGPNRKWVTDITTLPTAAGWAYLAVVLDLFSRKVVGWSLGDSLATTLASNALRDAIENRKPERGELLHHSDRGCQYTSDDYQKTLKTLDIQCSMSRIGDGYDNAVMERFFWSLKHEWTNWRDFANLEEARLSVFNYIQTFYNPMRRHQTLGYKSPNLFDAENAPAQAA